MQAVAARRGKDPEVIALTQKLLGISAEFAELWRRRDVGVRRADRKRLIHPVMGELELNCLSLLSEAGTQRLLWFTPCRARGQSNNSNCFRWTVNKK